MIKKSKGIIFVLFIIFISIFMCSCYGKAETVDNEQTKKQEENQKDMAEKVDDPKIKHWTEKGLTAWLYELRDDPKLKCYYYTRCEMTGKYVYEGTCIGYGIPYSAQYSNPEKVIEGDKAIGYDLYGVGDYLMVIPQAEPNGMFMPSSSSATWIIKTDPNDPKKMYAEYQESLITVTKYKKPRHMVEEWSIIGIDY